MTSSITDKGIVATSDLAEQSLSSSFYIGSNTKTADLTEDALSYLTASTCVELLPLLAEGQIWQTHPRIDKDIGIYLHVGSDPEIIKGEPSAGEMQIRNVLFQSKPKFDHDFLEEVSGYVEWIIKSDFPMTTVGVRSAKTADLPDQVFEPVKFQPGDDVRVIASTYDPNPETVKLIGSDGTLVQLDVEYTAEHGSDVWYVMFQGFGAWFFAADDLQLVQSLDDVTADLADQALTRRYHPMDMVRTVSKTVGRSKFPQDWVGKIGQVIEVMPDGNYMVNLSMGIGMFSESDLEPYPKVTASSEIICSDSQQNKDDKNESDSSRNPSGFDEEDTIRVFSDLTEITLSAAFPVGTKMHWVNPNENFQDTQGYETVYEVLEYGANDKMKNQYPDAWLWKPADVDMDDLGPDSPVYILLYRQANGVTGHILTTEKCLRGSHFVIMPDNLESMADLVDAVFTPPAQGTTVRLRRDPQAWVGIQPAVIKVLNESNGWDKTWNVSNTDDKHIWLGSPEAGAIIWIPKDRWDSLTERPLAFTADLTEDALNPRRDMPPIGAKVRLIVPDDLKGVLGLDATDYGQTFYVLKVHPTSKGWTKGGTGPSFGIGNICIGQPGDVPGYETWNVPLTNWRSYLEIVDPVTASRNPRVVKYHAEFSDGAYQVIFQVWYPNGDQWFYQVPFDSKEAYILFEERHKFTPGEKVQKIKDSATLSKKADLADQILAPVVLEPGDVLELIADQLALESCAIENTRFGRPENQGMQYTVFAVHPEFRYRFGSGTKYHGSMGEFEVEGTGVEFPLQYWQDFFKLVNKRTADLAEKALGKVGPVWPTLKRVRMKEGVPEGSRTWSDWQEPKRWLVAVEPGELGSVVREQDDHYVVDWDEHPTVYAIDEIIDHKSDRTDAEGFYVKKEHVDEVPMESTADLADQALTPILVHTTVEFQQVMAPWQVWKCLRNKTGVLYLHLGDGVKTSSYNEDAIFVGPAMWSSGPTPIDVSAFSSSYHAILWDKVPGKPRSFPMELISANSRGMLAEADLTDAIFGEIILTTLEDVDTQLEPHQIWKTNSEVFACRYLHLGDNPHTRPWSHVMDPDGKHRDIISAMWMGSADPGGRFVLPSDVAGFAESLLPLILVSKDSVSKEADLADDILNSTEQEPFPGAKVITIADDAKLRSIGISPVLYRSNSVRTVDRIEPNVYFIYGSNTPYYNTQGVIFVDGHWFPQKFWKEFLQIVPFSERQSDLADTIFHGIQLGDEVQIISKSVGDKQVMGGPGPLVIVTNDFQAENEDGLPVTAVQGDRIWLTGVWPDFYEGEMADGVPIFADYKTLDANTEFFRETKEADLADQVLSTLNVGDRVRVIADAQARYNACLSTCHFPQTDVVYQIDPYKTYEFGLSGTKYENSSGTFWLGSSGAEFPLEYWREFVEIIPMVTADLTEQILNIPPTPRVGDILMFTRTKDDIRNELGWGDHFDIDAQWTVTNVAPSSVSSSDANKFPAWKEPGEIQFRRESSGATGTIPFKYWYYWMKVVEPTVTADLAEESLSGKLEDQSRHYANYYRNFAEDSAEALIERITGNVEHSNRQFAPLFGRTEPADVLSVLDIYQDSEGKFRVRSKYRKVPQWVADETSGPAEIHDLIQADREVKYGDISPIQMVPINQLAFQPWPIVDTDGEAQHNVDNAFQEPRVLTPVPVQEQGRRDGKYEVWTGLPEPTLDMDYVSLLTEALKQGITEVPVVILNWEPPEEENPA